jgi:general stress protein CsbA
MKSSQLFRLAGWSGYVSVVAMLAGGLVGIFLIPGPLAKLENLTTIALALAMAPLALALYQLHRKRWPGLILAATLIGVVAMLTAAGAKFLVFIDVISSEGVADVLASLTFTFIGVWLVVVGYLGWLYRIPSISLAAMAITAGVGMILGTTGFLISEPPPLWAMAGGGVTIVAYPIWAISIGRWLLRQSTAKHIAESAVVA